MRGNNEFLQYTPICLFEIGKIILRRDCEHFPSQRGCPLQSIVHAVALFRIMEVITYVRSANNCVSHINKFVL